MIPVAIWVGFFAGYLGATLRNGAVVLIFDRLAGPRRYQFGASLNVTTDPWQDRRWIADVTTDDGSMFRGVGKTPARATLNAVKYLRRGVR